MRKTFNRYLSLVVVLLLNTFASLQANEVNSTITDYVAIHNFSVSQFSAENSNDPSISHTTFSLLDNDTDNKLLFDVIENSEGEDEELSSRKKSPYKDYLEMLFINEQLFKIASKELQKSIYRPKNDINDPSLRLHIQFQVFII